MPDEAPSARPLRMRLAAGRDEIQVGEHFALAFQRTLRIPEDGRTYPLPPGLGRLPIVALEALPDGAPERLRALGGFAIGLYQREATWIAFVAPSWRPHAVQVSVGGVNAIDGGPGGRPLSDAPQNYVVAPHQPWLDGINAGTDHVRQFVALPLDDPRTIEGQLRGRAERGGLDVRVVPPKPGRFPETAPPEPEARKVRSSGGMMGLGAGGRIAQRIFRDPYGLDAWDESAAAAVRVHILNSAELARLTGTPPPPSPITAATYARHGFPWFTLYDEDLGAVPPSAAFEGLAPAATGGERETGVDVAEEAVRTIRRDRDPLPET